MGLQDTGCEVVITKLFPFELFVTLLQSTISSDFCREACERNFSWLHAQTGCSNDFAVTLPHVLMPNLKTRQNGTTRQPNLMMLPIGLESASLGFQNGGQITTVWPKTEPVSFSRSPHTYNDINMRKTLT